MAYEADGGINDLLDCYTAASDHNAIATADGRIKAAKHKPNNQWNYQLIRVDSGDYHYVEYRPTFEVT